LRISELTMGHGGGKKDDQETKKVLHIRAILLQNRESGTERKKSQNGTIFVINDLCYKRSFVNDLRIIEAER
jgi:hypothetical protein